MHYWKILVAVSMITWYLPVLKFRKDKYFLYFLMNSLVDPFYVLLKRIFHIQLYNYLPIVLLVEICFFPIKDIKIKAVSLVALAALIMNLGENTLLEQMVSQIISSLMIYSVAEEIYYSIKTDSSFNAFLLVLISYFLRNSILIYFYYNHTVFLITHYTIFLLPVVIMPVFIAYFGPDKKIYVPFLVNKSTHISKSKIHNETGNKYGILSQRHGLTKMEIKVLYEFSNGLKSKEIAEKLFITQKAIYFHCGNIKSKLNFKTTNQIIKFAFENQKILQESQKLDKAPASKELNLAKVPVEN